MENVTQRPITEVTTFEVDRKFKELQRLLQDLPILFGNGTPEGVKRANIGTLYLRLDGGTGTSFYVKESSNGEATGWVAK